MPQFDFFAFSTQVFWILVGYFAFYFFILKFFLVNISETIKLRKSLIKKVAKKDNSYDYILSLIFKN